MTFLKRGIFTLLFGDMVALATDEIQAVSIPTWIYMNPTGSFAIYKTMSTDNIFVIIILFDPALSPFCPSINLNMVYGRFC